MAEVDPSRTIPLVCLSCDAPLKVPEQVEVFSCSYCGALQILRIEGGIAFAERFHARRIEPRDALPTAETDVLAARLSMDRLRAEWRTVDDALRRERRHLSETFGDRLDSAHRQTLVAVIFGCLSVLVALAVLAAWDHMAQQGAVVTGLGIGLVLGTAIGNVIVSFRTAKAVQDELAGHFAALTAGFQAETNRLSSSFEQARKIVEK